MNKRYISLISLGCDKNRVDAEYILGNLKSNGFVITNDLEQAQIIIVNTCAFLASAREESIDTILDCIKYKSNKLEKLIVTGCLSQLGIEELKSALPEVDAFVPIDDNDKIVEIINKLYGETNLPKAVHNRILSTPKHYAYLKIADGCNNFCTYCKIPYIRGRYYSIPMEQIVAEATDLVAQGVKELIVVAQDVTNYGQDLYSKPMLVQLLRKLSEIDGIEWIRLHYCYPDKITEELIDEIAHNDKIVKYIDMPLQHISDNILSKMGRHIFSQQIQELIDNIRAKIPDIVIRTTLMVGFPNEKHNDFVRLCDFLKSNKLELVGFFAYSREEGTRSYQMRHQVPTIVKKLRLKKIEKLQESISHNNLVNMLDNTYKVLVDRFDDQTNQYFGRNYMFSPNVDYEICFYSDKKVKIGSFVNIKITQINKNYLIGEKV